MGLLSNAGPMGLSPFYLTREYDMRMKLNILLDPNPVYTGDEVHTLADGPWTDIEI